MLSRMNIFMSWKLHLLESDFYIYLAHGASTHIKHRLACSSAWASVMFRPTSAHGVSLQRRHSISVSVTSIFDDCPPTVCEMLIYICEKKKDKNVALIKHHFLK